MRHTCPKGLVAGLLRGKLENCPKDEDIRQDNTEQVQHHYKHGHSNAVDIVEASVPTGQPYYGHVLTVAVGNHGASAVVEAPEQKGEWGH